MKILGSDFDGTLTCGGIGEEKLAAIAKWQKAGNKFGLVSGRNVGYLEVLKEMYPSLKLDFFAACNGGYIIDGEGNLLRAIPCEGVELISLVKELLAWGATFAHVVADEYLCAVADMKNRPSFVPEDKCCLVDDIPNFPCYYEVSVEFSSPQEAEPMVRRVREKYGAWLTPLQNGRCIDIVPLGVDKAKGLYLVMEYFGASYDDVIAVGDSGNDEAMIREFRSYAMESGTEYIKQFANGVIRDVTEIFEKEM